MTWVKHFTRFLGESHTFSGVLFTVFMGTCWLGAQACARVPACSPIASRGCTARAGGARSAWVCTSATFYCLAVFRGDEVYRCLQVTSLAQCQRERCECCGVRFCCWGESCGNSGVCASPHTCWGFRASASSSPQLPAACLCFSHSSHEATLVL